MKDQHPLLTIDLRGIPLKMAGFHVPRYTMQTLLRDIDPEGTESRRRHRLRRRVYSNPGRNYAWHIDGHDKLKPSGLAIHGALLLVKSYQY